MGYACLTLIYAEAGGEKEARARYKIARNVLSKFGELTGYVGDALSAHKFHAKKTKRPHTPAEEHWVLQVVRQLIARIGEYDFDPATPLKQITLADLPKV